MVKHIVLFQLDTAMPAERKQQVMTGFKRAIEALPGVVPGLRKAEVGFNANPAECYDIALYSELDTLDDVKSYAVHPAHVAAAGIIKPYILSRASTDFVTE